MLGTPVELFVAEPSRQRMLHVIDANLRRTLGPLGRPRCKHGSRHSADIRTGRYLGIEKENDSPLNSRFDSHAKVVLRQKIQRREQSFQPDGRRRGSAARIKTAVEPVIRCARDLLTKKPVADTDCVLHKLGPRSGTVALLVVRQEPGGRDERPMVWRHLLRTHAALGQISQPLSRCDKPLTRVIQLV